MLFLFLDISLCKWNHVWLQGENFEIRKVDGVKAMSKDSVPAFSDLDRQILLGWWRHHLGASPTGTCHGQPPSAASLIHSLALQHAPNRSSQPILQESCKFTCGTHQLSAYIPMPFHICEYSLGKGGGSQRSAVRRLSRGLLGFLL